MSLELIAENLLVGIVVKKGEHYNFCIRHPFTEIDYEKCSEDVADVAVSKYGFIPNQKVFQNDRDLIKYMIETYNKNQPSEVLKKLHKTGDN